MKRKVNIIALMLFMMFLSSCGGPDALLINQVHKDGSVTRKVILTYTKDEFDLYKCQVPVDSTWNITRAYDVSVDGDTTYSLTAVKDFESVEEVNKLYEDYDGSNPGMIRNAKFKRRFRWFNTIYRYSENINHVLAGIAPEDFFTEEELEYFYMPEKLVDALLEGPDSTRIKEDILEPLEEKKEEWLGRSLVKVYIDKIVDTVSANPAIKIDTSNLYSKADKLASSMLFDVWEEEVLLDTIFGKGFYQNNIALTDSILSDIEDQFDPALNADEYLIQTIMPGDLIDTNGYTDEEGNILWEVNGDVFMASDYNMWAESKTVNLWAWIVTGAFVLFVMIGMIVRVIKK